MQNIEAGGAVIPAIGFGTFRMSEAETMRMVPAALNAGFTHIDTAQIYGNEAAVGEGIRKSGMERDSVFVTTKVWVENYRPERFAASVEESLRKLKTDHVDLLLLHWPNDAVPLENQIEALNDARRGGKTRHIGVSNFNRALLERAIALSDAPIVTNQIEVHPYLDQSVMKEAATRSGVAISAYYAMADGKVFDDPVLKRIAGSHGRSVAQVVLRWLIQQGMVALSKTATENRLAENIDVFDFELDASDMTAISARSSRHERLVSPDGLAPKWD